MMLASLHPIVSLVVGASTDPLMGGLTCIRFGPCKLLFCAKRLFVTAMVAMAVAESVTA
jgi:hypothetical protein